MNKKTPNKIIIEGKPKYIKLGDDYNFFSIFKKIEKNYKNCFLFESLGEESNISRFHIIGFDPKYIISSDSEKELIITDVINNQEEKYFCDNPYFTLREIIPQNIISRKYAGGLVGFISYDSINFFEDDLQIKKNVNFESFKFGVYLDGLILDQMTGEIFYYYYEENKIELLKNILDKTENITQSVETEFIGNSMNRDEHKLAVLKIKDNIKMIDTVDWSMDDIDSHCEKHKPDIIVIDQLDKVNMSGTFARTDEKLRAIYTSAREIAKRRECVVIAISQASADAHNRDHISFDMMENSKTGKAAEADLIIGIGNRASNDPTNTSRVLNVSKNKITGWHGDPSCILDKYISRFTD